MSPDIRDAMESLRKQSAWEYPLIKFELDRLYSELTTANEALAKAEAREKRLRELVNDMECSCLPYAYETGEGMCQRCAALAQEDE